MSRIKESMLQNEYDADLIEFLEKLLEREELQDVTEGIAKQVVTKGVDSMSAKQKAVIDALVAKYEEENVCDRCSNGNVSALSDYIFIADNSMGLCPMCFRDYEKYMED